MARPWLRYALALACAAVAVALAGALAPLFGGAYFAVPLAVIALFAVVMGMGPGFLATLIAGAGIWILLDAQDASQNELLRLLAFLVAGGVVSAVAGLQHKTSARYAAERTAARQAAREAERTASALRESLDAQRESEARFRQLADSMPQIVWAARPDGTLDYYNRKWYELTGAVEGASGDQSWLPILHPDDQQRCLDVWYASVRTGKPYQIEYRFKFPNIGEYRWHLGRALPTRDASGKIVRWYGTSTDIDDSKRTEAALRESEQRHRALAEALREADRRKDDFLALLSHELRNPLAPVKNSLYILERAAPGSEQAARALRVMDRQIGHMARLIDDLLDVTRISRGKIHIQCVPLELNEVVRRTVEDHRSVFERSGVVLDLRLAGRPVWVRGDETRLSQVVGNLLQNAAKFAGHGGRARVSVEANDRGQALVRVADTGPGIPAEVLPRLFEPFTQADATLDRSRGGLGLGLALVKGLVELHGGEVRAHSAGPGEGAELLVYLPEAPAPAPPEAHPGAPRHAHAGRVLVIEDNADAAATLKEALEFSNHEVEVAHSGPEGLNKARALRPDVILCDIGLPGMDGYEVARALRADPAHRATRLIALTGYASPEDRRRATAAGFDRHLAKPPDLGTLERILSELGGERRPDEGARSS